MSTAVIAIAAVVPFAQTEVVNQPLVDGLGAVVAGFAITALARLLVPRVRVVGWSTSALLAIVAGSVALGVANAFDRDRTLPVVLLALAATILALIVATMVHARLHPAVAVHASPTGELLRLGESGSVEFKSTARRNLHTRERDPKIELVIAKTVCGLLNGRGGTLVVGVDDEGNPLGLADDMDLMKRPDTDAFHLFLRDLLNSTLGVPAGSGVRVRFEDVPGAAGSVEVCRIDVEPSPAPVYLTPPREKGRGQGEPEFWVRSGNGTRRLRIDELLEYHRRRWGGWRARLLA